MKPFQRNKIEIPIKECDGYYFLEVFFFFFFSKALSIILNVQKPLLKNDLYLNCAPCSISRRGNHISENYELRANSFLNTHV